MRKALTPGPSPARGEGRLRTRSVAAARAPADLARANDGLSYRTFAVRASTIDEEERSIEALVSTEAPVPMWDYERWEAVPEVLLTKGCQLPAGKQCPFLDAHSRWSVATLFGSIRGLKKADEGVVGRVFFSSTAEDAWTKVREGHLTDISAGYQILEVTHVPRGQRQKIAGRDFEGPVNVVTKWRLKEGSAVPIGADELSKMRGQEPPRTLKEEFRMDPELRAELEERGMPATHTDALAQQWMLTHLRAATNPTTPPAGGGTTLPPAATGERTEAPPAAPVVGQAGMTAEQYRAIVSEELTRREQQRLAFRREVDELCGLAGVPVEARLYDLPDVAAVRKAVLEAKSKLASDIPGGIRVEGGAAQRDKHRGLVGSALLVRCLAATGCRPESIERVFPAAQRAAGYEQYAHASLIEVARECLLMDGFNVRGLTREQMAIAALGFPHQVGLRTGDPGYHVTASFANLTLDAINKSMQVGYTEFPSTWRGPMRQASSVPDFKQIHRLRMGAAPNLPVWPDNQDPAKGSFTDAKESYAVEARSLELSFSYRCLVNEDMEMLSRAPAQLGTAAARTVNTVAWSKVTANGTLSDSVALFAVATGARKRTNLTTGAGAPSTATLQTLTNLMMQMRGENTAEANEGPDLLGLMPTYLVGPSALRTTILQLLTSIADVANANPNVANINRNLIPVIEPLLDADSTTAWYLFASPSLIDTVEVTFMEGQETVVTREWTDERSLARIYVALQTFEAKALNHRGVQKHAGA